jgi:hypothetical protein
MANAPVLPRIARNVVEEHRALRTLLAEVEGAFARPAPHAASGPDVVAARLDTLRGPLGAHFEEEERAGLFEEIEERAPPGAAAGSARSTRGSSAGSTRYAPRAPKRGGGRRGSTTCASSSGTSPATRSARRTS